VSRYDDPSWYEKQPESDNGQESSSSQEFEHYPFLPSQDQDQDAQQSHKAVQAPSYPSRKRSYRKLAQTLGFFALLLIAFGAGWFGHAYADGTMFLTQSSQSKQYEMLFDQAWTEIDQNYVDRSDINYQKMSYAAINAMVQTLGDTGHTRFMTAQEAQTENQQLSGQFIGIGIYLSQNATTKNFYVTSPIPGSPAAKAGIKANDQIVAVNGVSLTGKTTTQVTSMIQGKAGTTVSITVIHAGSTTPQTYKVTREEINVPNVTMHYIAQDHTVDIQVVQFANGVSNQVKTDVLQAKKMGATKIVLDLRDNPGGYLNEAVDMVSLFVKQGNVLIQQNRSGQRTPIPVTGNAIDTTTPMVVLVNQNTASAAEIVSGSLKDNHRATIIGEKTFGTGTVLEPFNLANGSQLLIGVQEWLTPDGQFIRNLGITPNITVALPKGASELFPTNENSQNMSLQQILDSGDTQLKAAIQYLQNK
jgi:carboxyl-terminal processing protease